ncbi:MAG TPA: pyridoxal phosphate-dependent aminotransferase family protein [Actinomycetota bacterium]
MQTQEPETSRGQHSEWLNHCLRASADLARLRTSQPMLDAVIDEIAGRMIRVGDQWLADFASCNYLGFDLEPEIMAAIPAYVARWGTHPSWSRLLGSPVLYRQIEEQLAHLLGAPDVLALPTITHIHMSVIPVLAGSGTILVDRRAHKTIYDGCSVAKSHGATLTRYPHDDLEALEKLLGASPAHPRMICTDGINSMTGNGAPLAELARLARKYDATLYVDDAHGFGVIGERSADETCPYGSKGNGIVRFSGESYDNIVLVAGCSKAYSSLLAFIACPTAIKDFLKVAAPPYLYSGPSPVASLATVLAGLEVNKRRGDTIRADLSRKTRRVLEALDERGIATPNDSGFPIIEIALADSDDIDDVGRFLFSRGIYVTLAAYPLVPRSDIGFRVQVTAANTDAEIDQLVGVLDELKVRYGLQMVEERGTTMALAC